LKEQIEKIMALRQKVMEINDEKVKQLLNLRTEENTYAKTFQVGETALLDGREVIITNIAFDIYSEYPEVHISVAEVQGLNNYKDPFVVKDITQLEKANLCELCDKIIPQGEAFCSKCKKELEEEVKSGTEDTYPCSKCGVEIPATEPYCSECSKDFKKAKKAA